MLSAFPPLAKTKTKTPRAVSGPWACPWLAGSCVAGSSLLRFWAVAGLLPASWLAWSRLLSRFPGPPWFRCRVRGLPGFWAVAGLLADRAPGEYLHGPVAFLGRGRALGWPGWSRARWAHFLGSFLP
jgi:hypothetical protein